MHTFAPWNALGQRGRGKPDSGPKFEDVDTAEHLSEHPGHATRRMDLCRDHLQQRRLASSIGTNHDPAVCFVNLPVDVADQGGTVPDDAYASQIHDSCHGFNL